ncbi:hypothetical protein BLNAU_23824 [Blattamonas nauphoetae]|uniref:Uncharacterized protein n=1 Tax=Blattamonas nauphoetae TaxID=2049346 RepID=A0ABQ9WP45_9EUKA|nr:hypothetical protein BLNAU_23824 [Blattamonas nauphoetae]
MFFDESSLTDFDSGLVHPDSFKNVAFQMGAPHSQLVMTTFDTSRICDTGQPEERNSEDGYWKKDFFPQRQHTLKDDWG